VRRWLQVPAIMVNISTIHVDEGQSCSMHSTYYDSTLHLKCTAGGLSPWRCRVPLNVVSVKHNISCATLFGAKQANISYASQ
jgi:hypothetical protein